VPKPPEVPLPDAREFLLPQLAYLYAYSTQTVSARRAALADSRAHFEEVSGSGSEHEAQLGLLGLIGDAMQAVEDVGNLGSAVMEGIEGLASYVKATVYHPSYVNNFYAQMHKRELDYFMRLCAFRFGEFTMTDFFEFDPPLSDAERSAFARAEEATAALIAEHLIDLAQEWDRYRRFFHAYKHAALVANPEDVTILRDGEQEIPGIVVWARKREEPEIGDHATMDLTELAAHAATVGELAIEMIGYLVDTRFKVFDAIEFSEDGEVVRTASGTAKTEPLRRSPWTFWTREGDLDEATLELMASRGVRLAGL
jgi:hypothetical protein